MATPAFTFTAEGVTVFVFAEQQGPNSVGFTFQTQLAEGYRIDLNGFFLDIGEEGGSDFRVEGERANNMLGANNDGYDYAVGLGSIGGNDADYRSGSIVIEGISLADLVGADAGLRATSYGQDGEGSLKLVADYTPPDEPPGDDFPPWGQDISNVILVFDTKAGDTKPAPDGDGYYTVKIDTWDDANVAPSNDLDDSIDAILAYLIANDPNVDADTELLGAIIKGGTEATNFYAFGENNTDPDTPPVGLGLSWTGSSNPQPANAVDVSYDYIDIFPAAVPDQIFV